MAVIEGEMASYSVAEAKNRLPALLNAAQRGEEVVITRRGEPIAVINPVTPPRPNFDMAAMLERLRVGRSKLPFSEISGAEEVWRMREEDLF